MIYIYCYLLFGLIILIGLFINDWIYDAPKCYMPLWKQWVACLFVVIIWPIILIILFKKPIHYKK